jgi:tRNA(fMet)-specific endonuclease VapC
MYLLDTNIISFWMRGDSKVIQQIRAQSPLELSFSTITLAEILYGIQKSPVKKKERLSKINRISSFLYLYPFDEAAAEKYALVRNQLEKSGKAISERDTQIVAIALANGLTIVTHNVKEFSRVDDLMVEDWA